MFALFIPALMGALVGAVGTMIGRAIIAAGVGFVTYKGMDVALGALKAQTISKLSAIPADVIGLAGFLWVDKALSVVFSALAAAVVLKAIGGSVKKAVLK